MDNPEKGAGFARTPKETQTSSSELKAEAVRRPNRFAKDLDLTDANPRSPSASIARFPPRPAFNFAEPSICATASAVVEDGRAPTSCVSTFWVTAEALR